MDIVGGIGGTLPNEMFLKPSKAKEALRDLLAADQPGILWGPPGIGKSDLMKQLAQLLGYQLKDDRAVLKDPVDLRGMPAVIDGKTTWALPADFPTCGKGVWFMDELNRAPTLVQNAYFQLVLDRQLGEYRMPPEWRVMAACNYEDGGVQRMPAALMNRFVHVHLVVDVDDWCNWALDAGLEVLMIAFMRFRPELLHKFDRQAKAFPTPRSWAFVDKIIKQKPSVEVRRALVAGAVGEGAEVEFTSFYELYKNLPNIDAILLDPANAAMVTEAIQLYAVSAALANRAKPENFSRVMTYLNRLPEEYSVFAVKSAVARNPDLQSTMEFIEWSVKHQEFI